MRLSTLGMVRSGIAAAQIKDSMWAAEQFGASRESLLLGPLVLGIALESYEHRSSDNALSPGGIDVGVPDTGPG